MSARSDPVAFARLLRSAGIEVPVSATVTYAEALAVLGVERPDAVYWAGRATLVRRGEDRAVYDECFARFFLGADEAVDAPGATQSESIGFDDPGESQDSEDTSDSEDQVDTSVRWSRLEALRQRDLAGCSPAELEELWRLLPRMRFTASTRRSHRLVPTTARRGVVDLRRTARAALRTEGEPLRRHHRRPGVRPRRLVLLLDVSGSMEPYARGLLRFAHAALVARRSVEVFTMGTRLTRITRELSSRDPDTALRRVATAVDDLSGGTRLGDTLHDFNDRWGGRGMAHGADVVILSDGWDRGEPDDLEAQMTRLWLIAHRVIWVNPLKATPDYAPLARGMAAALPHVDLFVEGHSFDSLESLANVLVAAGSQATRSVGSRP